MHREHTIIRKKLIFLYISQYKFNNLHYVYQVFINKML